MELLGHIIELWLTIRGLILHIQGLDGQEQEAGTGKDYQKKIEESEKET